MKLITLFPLAATLTLLVAHCLPLSAHAQGTAFTYQGRLDNAGAPATGSYDLRFQAFPSSNSGPAISILVTNSPTPVSNGLFTVTLDLGAGVFTGADRWLEVGVRTNGSGTFFTLAPRQKIAPTPYAMYAGNVSAANITGTIPAASIANGSITSAMLAPGAVTNLGSPDGTPASALNVDTNGYLGLGTSTPTAGLSIVTGPTDIALRLLAQIPHLTPSGIYFYNLTGLVHVAAKSNLLAVVSYSQNVVELVSITNPASPVLESFISDIDTNLTGANFAAFSPTSNLLAISAFSDSAVTLVDVNDIRNPVKRSTLRDGVGGYLELGGASAVAFSSNLLAIAAYNDNAVTLADVSNPASPVFKIAMKNGQFGFTNLDGATGLAFSGNLLAIAARNASAVTLVDVSNPTSPVLRAVLKNGVGGFNDLTDASRLAFFGNLLAISAETANAVTLVDVSNPASPVLRSVIKQGVGGFGYLHDPYGIAFSGNVLAITSQGDNAVTLADVSNPSAPQFRGVARQSVAGVDYLRGVSSVAFVGTNLVTSAFVSAAFTLFAPDTQPVSLNTAGWVGIGVASPQAALQVNGNVVVEGASLFSIHADRVELGTAASASGDKAIALGDAALATGPDNTALGHNAVASPGAGATAIGANSLASGAIVSLGGSTANTALGFHATASGSGEATALGSYTLAGDVEATAVGVSATASGDESTALGSSTTASGSGSTAVGYSSSATGQFATALGGGSANGIASIAAGGALANGYQSIALGRFTTAGGTNSIAVGTSALASGNQSVALGYNARATNDGAFVWADTANDPVGSHPFYSTIKDSFNVRASGGVYLRGGTDVNPGSGGLLILGPTNSFNLAMDDNEVMARNNGAVSPLVLNANGGFVGIGRTPVANELELNGNASKSVAGSWLANSDARIKQDIQPVSSALETLARVRPVSFRYTDDYRAQHRGITDRRYLNVVAQEFREVFPDDVKSSGEKLPDGSEILQVDTYPLTIYSAAAIQELNEKFKEELKRRDAENDALKSRLEKLEHLLNQKNTGAK